MITESTDDRIELHKERVRRFYTLAFVRHDLQEARKLMAPDYILHDPSVSGGYVAGTESWTTLRSRYINAVPDHQLIIEEQVAEGDKVVTRWSVHGTQMKDLPHAPAQEKPFHVTGIVITRLQDGLIAEEWQDWDSQGFYQQIGAEPDFRAPAA